MRKKSIEDTLRGVITLLCKIAPCILCPVYFSQPFMQVKTKKSPSTVWYILIGTLILFNLFWTIFTWNQYLRLPPKISLESALTPIPTLPIFKTISIDQWFPVSQSAGYKIFYSGVKDGGIVAVLDKIANQLLVPSDSCEVTIPTAEKKRHNYYNDSVGIKILGPYKSIDTQNSSQNIFKQSVLSSGCVHDEGTIKLLTRKNVLVCEIQVQYILIGC